MEIAGNTKKKILIVDDEQAIANSLSWVLEMEGFETSIAYSGEEAVEKALSFKPEILICDIRMAGISGIEAATQIRETLPACHVILISGHVFLPDLAAGGAGSKPSFDFLSKPVHPRVLIKKLRTLLRATTDPS
jgi:two-component system, OmpR family, alkaline phosphatase synthesis response regulator PhoP